MIMCPKCGTLMDKISTFYKGIIVKSYMCSKCSAYAIIEENGHTKEITREALKALHELKDSK